MSKRILHNDGKHLYQVLMYISCKKHQAETGMPCFAIFPGAQGRQSILAGACGDRIRKAGFNGKISPTSFQSRRPAGPNEGGKPHQKKKEAA